MRRAERGLMVFRLSFLLNLLRRRLAEASNVLCLELVVSLAGLCERLQGSWKGFCERDASVECMKRGRGRVLDIVSCERRINDPGDTSHCC
jgi:hypothetical protein